MDSPPQSHDQEDQAPEPVSGSPSDFLKNIVGKKVKVRIGSGVDYHGTSLIPYSLSLHYSQSPFYVYRCFRRSYRYLNVADIQAS
jgi:hypothetical protein